MSLKLGVARETLPGERRVSLVPDLIKRYTGQGAQVLVQTGAGEGSHYPDGQYKEAELFEEAGGVYSQSDIVLAVQPPSDKALNQMKPGSVLVGLLDPWRESKRINTLLKKEITAFSLELLPRISRAQSMDALSSQASAVGYVGALLGAHHCPKFFPMLTYAAGTVRPAKVLVIGAGVAGLQAIATAKRLGGQIEGYDVRPETREQIESLGARFVDTGVEATGEGGYARELTEQEKAQQADKLNKAIIASDVVITTAAVPGKAAPRIIDAATLEQMKPGAVVVDLAAESGGNVEGVQAGKDTRLGNVLVLGPTHIASRLATHASEMYAKNLYNFVSPMIKDGELVIDWEDEVLSGTCLTHAGELRHSGVKQALGL